MEFVSGWPSNMSDAIDPLIGKVIGDRYHLEQRVAEGGMGAVYLARRLDNNERAAVKVLRPEVRSQDSTIKRFIREAQLLSVLRHPNTVSVYHYGDDEVTGAVYLAMEYLAGVSLFNHVRDNGRMELAYAASVLLQILASLEDAHEKGVVHRDLKPGNVMIIENPGEPVKVKVLDFGLAKVYDSEALPLDHKMTALTKAGEVVGTLHYMAPEQLRGDPITATADIYAAAVILFFMLAGRRPFEGKKNAQVLAAQLTQPFPRLSVPPSIQEVIDVASAKDQSKRYQTALAFEQALLAAIPQEERTVFSTRNPIPAVKKDPPSTPQEKRTTMPVGKPATTLQPKRFPKK
jgi:serine/threonine protein kinase